MKSTQLILEVYFSQSSCCRRTVLSIRWISFESKCNKGFKMIADESAIKGLLVGLWWLVSSYLLESI